MSDWIRLLVKYKGRCFECGQEIKAGEYGVWSKTNKAIKHVKCGSSASEKKNMTEVPELKCFICNGPAGCSECGFESDCDRQTVSQACICNKCIDDKQAFANYQEAFVKIARKVAKVKI